MKTIDVFVLGSGPAGCSVAINLARFCNVLMIDRNAAPRPRAGESLPPAANKLLSDMGLLADFSRQGHLPNYGNLSRWGTPDLNATDFLRDPAGHGWHLDRQRFEAWLQQKAVERGATLLVATRLESIERLEDGQWHIVVVKEGEQLNLQARIVVDASGRNPAIARRLGATRIQADNLVCGWLIGKDNPQANQQGLSYIQAVADGWWYTAPVPGGKRIIAFHTDTDQTDISWMRSAQQFLNKLQSNHTLQETICLETFSENPHELHHGTTAANSAVTEPFVGAGWLAAGDAAFSFDPLSSQGIFNALYTGLAAAESCYRFLRGEIHDFSEYGQGLHHILAAYQKHLTQWYGAERRWPDEPFWKARQIKVTK